MSDMHATASDPSLDAVAAELEALGEPLTEEERALIESDPSDWLDSSADMALTAGLVEAAHGPALSELGRRRAWGRIEEAAPTSARVERESASASNPGTGRSGWMLGLLALAAAVAALAVLVSRPPAGSGTPIASGEDAGEVVDPAELEELAGAARDGLLVLGLQDGDEGQRARDAAKDYAARLSTEGGQRGQEGQG